MSHKLTRIVLAMFALALLASSAFAADPGVDLPNGDGLFFNSQPSDQKKGSVLVYNLYTSSASGASSQNTRISLTNTNTQFSIAVHLFFVDGTSCSVADSYICLTANQTASFLASDIDPGITGYILAVATNGDGLPFGFDYLIGDEFVKMSSGHYASLGAEANSYVFDLGVLSADETTAFLIFGGTFFNRLPRVLANDNLASPQDGNSTILVVNRIGGSYSTGAATIGPVFGLFYDDAESAYSFTFSGGCQAINTLSDSFPRVVPRLSTIIPAGRTGWFKIWATGGVDNSTFGQFGGTANDTRAIFGAVLTNNANAGTAPNAFNGGHNLHKLTLNPFTVISVPIFPSNCSVNLPTFNNRAGGLRSL
jgi:hypothetical protein